MKKLIFLIVFLCSFLSLNAQNGTIQGKVTNDNGVSMEFVNILLLNALDSTLLKGKLSDEMGNFKFQEIEKGNYFIVAKFVGFTDQYSKKLESDNNVITLEGLILKQGVGLKEINVVAKKPFIEMKADKIVVNVENSAVNSGNSALEILEKSPGVMVDKDNNISLRGKQGVLVLINGKNQYMSGDDLARMLESMPAENISNIEIITNPSSKYDAEGNAGIINIRLKKSNKLGFNGSLNAGIRQGQKFSYNAGGRFNYRADRINIYESVSQNSWSGFQNLRLEKVIPFDGGVTSFDQTSDMLEEEFGFTTRLGMDYSFSEKTTIGFLYNFNSEKDIWNNDNTVELSGSNSPTFNLLKVIGKSDGTWNQNSFNFNVVHNFDDKGTSLSFDTDYSFYKRDFMNSYDNNYFDLEGNIVQNPFMLRNFEFADINIFASKLDFSKSFADEINLEAGVKLSMVKTDNDTQFEALENEDWINQTDRTNNFIYDENILAAYTNVSKSFGKINVHAGLRMEHTWSEGNSLTLNNSVPRNYTNFFPNLRMSHMIGEKHSLSYNYSRRINRPNYQDLNPFIGYLDDYTFSIGNPFLNAQYSNEFELSYGFNDFIYFSANYSQTKDAITEVIEQFSEENKTFQTTINLDDLESASLTVSTSIPWKQFGVSRINLVGFYNGFTSAIPSGTLDNQNFAWYLYVGNEFSLPSNIVFEISGNYRSKMTYGLFDLKPEYGIDLGFSKEILKGKGSIKIGVDDIFYTRKDRVSVNQDDINLNVFQTRDSRRVKLSFKYKFGNNKLKGARRRSTATEDEKSRIKG